MSISLQYPQVASNGACAKALMSSLPVFLDTCKDATFKFYIDRTGDPAQVSRSPTSAKIKSLSCSVTFGTLCLPRFKSKCKTMCPCFLFPVLLQSFSDLSTSHQVSNCGGLRAQKPYIIQSPCTLIVDTPTSPMIVHKSLLYTLSSNSMHSSDTFVTKTFHTCKHASKHVLSM